MSKENDFVPVLRFMAVSDIHIEDDHTPERDRFESAIKYAYQIAEASDSYKKLDALYIVGDFANSGSQVQMEAVRDIIEKNVKPGTLVRLTMASHEYNTRHGAEDAARERFAKIFNLPTDTHEVINGFHFIAVTTTRGCHFDDPQKDFARAELEKAAADGAKKPIFFFQHPHITDTVYGSINWGEDELIPILMDYPQIIDFSGHSHAPINDPRSIHQKHFTSLGTGTLSYFELDEFDKLSGTIPPEDDRAAQMLIVEADADNRVRVYPFDVLTGRFFPYTWKIDAPSDPTTFLYTDKRYKTAYTPKFCCGAKVEFDSIGTHSAIIKFAQAAPAMGEKYVNSYDIIVKEKESGIIKKQLSVWSQYYFSDMPAVISQEIAGLKPGTEYVAEIFANGFFKNKNERPLTAEFATSDS